MFICKIMVVSKEFFQNDKKDFDVLFVILKILSILIINKANQHKKLDMH